MLKLSCRAPEKSYEMSQLNLSNILSWSLHNTQPSPWHLWVLSDATNVVPVRTEANESMPSIQMYSVRGVHMATYGRRRSRIQVWVRKDTCRVIKQHHLFPGHAWPSKSLFFSYLLIWPRYQNLNHKIYHSINFTFRASCPYCLHTQDHAS